MLSLLGDIFGYLSAALMFSTFYMKRMIPLRVVGICANVTFIVFAAITHVWPLLVLHVLLLPLNILRMVQMMRLVKKVRESATGDFSLDFLVPFMTTAHYKKGDVLFRKGDESDKLFYLRKGLLRVEEVNNYVTDGQIIGEVGVFSTDKRRTATVVCESDSEFYTIPESTVLQLYYQNPKFGFHLMRLITARFTKNVEELDRIKLLVSAKDSGAYPVKRGAERMYLKLPLEVEGEDASGKMSKAVTVTENISTKGAYFLLRESEFAVGSNVTLLIDKDNTGMKISARVATVEKKDGGTGVGVVFLKDVKDQG